ncbi:transposable element Tcb1 transposase [Trichonephila clavipes]|nr:transposable element Tcb1 transposase [Trichonephila clavipes]
MNSIEHVWDALGIRVSGHEPHPQTLQELERALLEEWDRVPHLVINSLIDSMPQRFPKRANGTVDQGCPTRGPAEDFGKRNMPGKRARRHFSQLSEFERGRIIGMKTAGWSTRRAAGQVDRSEKTTRREDRSIVRQALVDPFVTRSTIGADVVFSYESWFVLGTDDNRLRVWRRPGDRYNSPQTVLRHTAHIAGVMIWGAVAYDCSSTLNVMLGTLMGQRYVDDILRTHVGPFLNGLLGAIFQQDNARPHKARVAKDFLRHFQTFSWPAHSPDLSPVEHVWDQLRRQMPSCHSVHDLELAVQDFWAHLPQDNIRCLINSMSDRVGACNTAGGGPTRY